MAGLIRLVDRSILRVAGQGSAKFLQGLCTQDMSRIAEVHAAPAAFLSAKGRVLCDTIVLSAGADEILLDCHADVSKQLLRFFMRHKLREPLKIEDVSRTHAAVALLPDIAFTASQSVGSDISAEVPSDFFRDPRFAAMGYRAVLAKDAADKLVGDTGHDLSAYHLWRLCCAVPEGPIDLPINEALPLFCNLDLLNFVSFTKGCYIGQELTMRTKHRGAVRRRFFSVVSAQGDPQTFLDSLDLDPSSPLPPSVVLDAAGASLPTFAKAAHSSENEAERTIQMRKDSGNDWKTGGVLHSALKNIGLGLLRCEGAMNNAENFKNEPFAAGTSFALGEFPLGIRPPPYAFVAS